MIPRVPPTQKDGAVFLRAVHYLVQRQHAASLLGTFQHTQNHMLAPSAVAMNLYKGRAGWMWIGCGPSSLGRGGPMVSGPSPRKSQKDGRATVWDQQHLRGVVKAQWLAMGRDGVWWAEVRFPRSQLPMSPLM